tara:strand:+ start:3106 stop:4026 length:921 start_codon:yes stop_codon:yes gene_type:complete
MNIACLTPISHLNGIKELLINKGVVYMEEEATKKEARALLLNKDIDTILCNPNQQTYKIDKELLEDTKVTLINTCSTGMNHIDELYCKQKGIEVYSLTHDMDLINDLPSTSELAFGLMMSLLRKIPQCQAHVHKNKWDYTQFMGRQVKDLRIGIVGYGRLGKMMYNFCKAFGAEVMVFDPFVGNIGCSSIEEMLSKSDVISLHVHVNEGTKYMINERLLGYIKENSYIVNTSRGEVVDERAIVDAINSGKLLGYATDVIEDEFGSIKKSPIVKAMKQGKNIIITPHVGGMTTEGQTKAYTWAINKL